MSEDAKVALEAVILVGGVAIVAALAMIGAFE